MNLMFGKFNVEVNAVRVLGLDDDRKGAMQTFRAPDAVETNSNGNVSRHFQLKFRLILYKVHSFEPLRKTTEPLLKATRLLHIFAAF